jgi:hypothetical protein
MLHALGIVGVTILALIWFFWPPGVLRSTEAMLKRSLIFIVLIILVWVIVGLLTPLVQPWSEQTPAPKPDLTPEARPREAFNIYA